jgi:hypothetical protein
VKEFVCVLFLFERFSSEKAVGTNSAYISLRRDVNDSSRGNGSLFRILSDYSSSISKFRPLASKYSLGTYKSTKFQQPIYQTKGDRDDATRPFRSHSRSTGMHAQNKASSMAVEILWTESGEERGVGLEARLQCFGV